MPRIDTRAGSMHVEEHGDGPPVLLLHATLHDRRDYDPVVPALSRHHRAIALDWPGHGDAGEASVPLSAELLADALVDVTAALDLGPAVVLGNSVGGFAAARLAVTHPHRVAGLVLVNTSGFFPPTPGTRLTCHALGRPAAARRVLPHLIPRYMRPQGEHDRSVTARAQARARTPEGARTAAALWRSFTEPGHDLRARAAAITAPTLVVCGRRDPIASPRVARRAHEAMPGSDLVLLETGHVPFSSRPEAFLDVVLPFMASATGMTAGDRSGGGTR